MPKRYFISLILSSFMIGCIAYHKIPKDDNGEPILNEKTNYKFTKIPNGEDLTKIDTSAYYVQIFEGRYYNEDEKKNPSIFIFHSDGFFKRTSALNNLKFDYRNKNSIFYGGKYKITENLIELEEFHPSQGEKTNYYSRNIRKGNIVGDRIIFDDGFSLLSIYEKKYELK